MSRGQGKGGFNSNTKKMFLGEHNLSKNNIQGHHSSSKKTKNHIAQTIWAKQPKLVLDFYSEIFWQIKLKELKSTAYSKEDVIHFFDGLTNMQVTTGWMKLIKPISDVMIYMDDTNRPSLGERALMIIPNGKDVRVLSANLVLTCLPFPVKERVVLIKDDYQKLKEIFSSYGIKITLRNYSSLSS